MKGIIIEDDLGTALDYEMVLNDCGVQDFKTFSTLKNAKEYLETNVVDFAILDVFINDKTCFQIVPQLNKQDCQIVIVTGYPKDSLIDKAIDAEAIALLSKPVNKKTLKFEIQRIKNNMESEDKSKFIFLKNGKSFSKIPYSKVMYFETEGNYTTIHTKDKKHVIKKSLKKMMEVFPKNIFLQVFRNQVVNTSHISSIDFTMNELKLNDHIIPIGKKYKRTVRETLGKEYEIIH